ncbi:MAG: globin domain-containing protein, partial [Bacteroidota bacterium]
YSLSRPEHLTLGLKKLGKSHVKYGVEAAHYPVVKEAMLETIAETLDDQKTEHVMKAWEAALSFIMDHMKNPED